MDAGHVLRFLHFWLACAGTAAAPGRLWREGVLAGASKDAQMTRGAGLVLLRSSSFAGSEGRA
jgi:hypothetical protein